MRGTAWILLIAGCSDYDLSGKGDADAPGRPAIGVDPLEVAFWEQRVGTMEERDVAITSLGEAPLTVDGVVVDVADFEVTPWAGVLDPGDSTVVTVTFRPVAPGAREGTLTVHSDDPDRPTVPVALTGIGVGPRLVVDPPTHDFGAVPAPCEDAVPVWVGNEGNADLMLDGLALEGDAYAVAGAPPLPVVLEPGERLPLSVTVYATGAAPLDGALTATSDDPAGPAVATFTALPTAGPPAEDRFVVPDALPTDLLFAVDQSASMDDDAESLAANFRVLVDALEEQTTGWHLGVVTYDHGCFNEGVLEVTSPDLDARFARAVTAGDDDEIRDDERLFQLVDRALQQDVPGGCNDGFRRPGSPLTVIVVSDEPERSVEESADWTWDHFVGLFEIHAGSPALLRVSGVVDLEGCADGADGYRQAIAATDGVALSICDADWRANAEALADAAIEGPWAFALTALPDPGSIAVTIDGAPLADGWRHDPVGNAIVVDDLAAGAVVVATYRTATDCG